MQVSLHCYNTAPAAGRLCYRFMGLDSSDAEWAARCPRGHFPNACHVCLSLSVIAFMNAACVHTHTRVVGVGQQAGGVGRALAPALLVRLRFVEL